LRLGKFYTTRETETFEGDPNNAAKYQKGRPKGSAGKTAGSILALKETGTRCGSEIREGQKRRWGSVVETRGEGLGVVINRDGRDRKNKKEAAVAQEDLGGRPQLNQQISQQQREGGGIDKHARRKKGSVLPLAR